MLKNKKLKRKRKLRLVSSDSLKKKKRKLKKRSNKIAKKETDKSKGREGSLIRYENKRCAFIKKNGKQCVRKSIGKGTLCRLHGGVVNADELPTVKEVITANGIGKKPTFDASFHPLKFIDLSREGMSVIEIAAHLEVSATTLRDWSERFKEFATAFEIGQALHESWYLQRGKDNLGNRHFNTTLFKFLTTNKLGYAEKIETKSTNTNLHGVLLVPDQVTEAEWEEIVEEEVVDNE